MVDSKYLARGDKTKRYLTDPEVVRLHQRRLTAITDGAALLDIEFGRDPFTGADRENAHLFVLAEPLSARPDLLRDITEDDWQPSRKLVQAGLTAELDALLGEVGASQFSQCLRELQSRDLRPDGVAWTSYGLAEGRTPKPESRVLQPAALVTKRGKPNLRAGITARATRCVGLPRIAVAVIAESEPRAGLGFVWCQPRRRLPRAERVCPEGARRR